MEQGARVCACVRARVGAVPLGCRRARKNGGARALAWLCVSARTYLIPSSFERVRVSVRACVRVRVHAEDYTRFIGVRHYQTGPAVAIMSGHAERGFACLDEKVLEGILERKGAPLPDQDMPDLDRKVDLQMACLSAEKPDWTEDQAAAALSHGFLLEHPNVYEDMEIPAEHIGEVLSATEAKEVAGYQKALDLVKAQKQSMLATRRARSRKYFKKSPAAAPLKPGLRKKPRWTAKPDASTASVSDWVKQHMPDIVRVLVDEVNGRWRLVGPSMNVKSVAWTKRGWESAAMECLYHGWQFYNDYSGRECPWNVEELRERFEVPATGPG